MDFKYLVIDDMGDRVKHFHELREAKHFISNKPEMTIKKLHNKTQKQIQLESFKQFTEKYGEPPF